MSPVIFLKVGTFSEVFGPMQGVTFQLPTSWEATVNEYPAAASVSEEGWKMATDSFQDSTADTPDLLKSLRYYDKKSPMEWQWSESPLLPPMELSMELSEATLEEICRKVRFDWPAISRAEDVDYDRYHGAVDLFPISTREDPFRKNWPVELDLSFLNALTISLFLHNSSKRIHDGFARLKRSLERFLEK